MNDWTPGESDNFLYKKENLPNSAVINGNGLSQTFQIYIHTIKPMEIIEKLPYKYGNLPKNHIINGKEVSTHDW